MSEMRVTILSVLAMFFASFTSLPTCTSATTPAPGSYGYGGGGGGDQCATVPPRDGAYGIHGAYGDACEPGAGYGQPESTSPPSAVILEKSVAPGRDGKRSSKHQKRSSTVVLVNGDQMETSTAANPARLSKPGAATTAAAFFALAAVL